MSTMAFSSLLSSRKAISLKLRLLLVTTLSNCWHNDFTSSVVFNR